ncbi:Hypothetical predicted protein [Podarcis lilfordi]|uniref:Uncharacterized protein n=1 Tax=Podarcis lilfordi TaxID=74358 RepID=A0AA35L4K7_9SAUR|nr:Hypothetical predicted protein [Podarcis lilfordi]
MSLKQTGGFSCRWLTFWIALSIVEGKYSSLFSGEENQDVTVELATADDESIDNTEFPVECGPRRLTKRSSAFGVPRLSRLDREETDCHILPLTTPTSPTTKARTTTPKTRKANTHRIVAAAAAPRLIYWRPFYLPRQPTFYRAFVPFNRHARHWNGKSVIGMPLWNGKSQSEDSSEEK